MNNNNPNNINQTLNYIFQMKNSGKNPQAIMQMLMQQNPQVAQMMTQFRNMSNGHNPRDFITQMARQNGLSEQNISAIQQMFQK
jgi:hypothetical protein